MRAFVWPERSDAERVGSTPVSSMRDTMTAARIASKIELIGPPEMSVPSPTRTPFSKAARSGKAAPAK